MTRATESESESQPKKSRNPKRPAVVSQLKNAGYAIERVIMRPDGSTEFLLAGAAPGNANEWDEVLTDGNC